jgi:hypothetical protein
MNAREVKTEFSGDEEIASAEAAIADTDSAADSTEVVNSTHDGGSASDVDSALKVTADEGNKSDSMTGDESSQGERL